MNQLEAAKAEVQNAFETQPAILLAGADDVVLFEDFLAFEMLSAGSQLSSAKTELCQRAWQARPGLLNLFRPKGFNGNFTDINAYILDVSPGNVSVTEDTSGSPTVAAAPPNSSISFALRANLAMANQPVGDVARKVTIRQFPLTRARDEDALWGRHIGADLGNNSVKDVIRRSSKFSGATQSVIQTAKLHMYGEEFQRYRKR